MKTTNLRTWAVAVAFAFLPGSAYALSISDLGVVGTIEVGTQAGTLVNETAWANLLLSLNANASTKVSAGDSDIAVAENYKTGTYDYNGTVSGGTNIAGTDASGSLYALARYTAGGTTAWYVMFYAPVFVNTIPPTSDPLWVKSGQGAPSLAYVIGFGSAGTGVGSASVPDGGVTLLLFSAALGGLGAVRRLIKSD